MRREDMLERLAEARIGRLGTVDSDERPHLVAITYATDGARVYSAVDQKPKSTTDLKRLRNIRSRPYATLLVDHYDDQNWDRLWWLRVDGSAAVDDSGPHRDRAIALLQAKYPQYATDPPQGSVISLQIDRLSGWVAADFTG